MKVVDVNKLIALLRGNSKEHETVKHKDRERSGSDANQPIISRSHEELTPFHCSNLTEVH